LVVFDTVFSFDCEQENSKLSVTLKHFGGIQFQLFVSQDYPKSSFSNFSLSKIKYFDKARLENRVDRLQV